MKHVYLYLITGRKQNRILQWLSLRDEAMDHFHPFFYFCVRFQSIFKFKRMLLKNSTGIIKSLSRDVCLTKRFCVWLFRAAPDRGRRATGSRPTFTHSSQRDPRPQHPVATWKGPPAPGKLPTAPCHPRNGGLPHRVQKHLWITRNPNKKYSLECPR